MKFGYITVTVNNGIIESLSNEKLKAHYNNSLLSTPDGMLLVYLSKLKGSKYKQMFWT